ncbi:MAG: AsmA family protein [Alphaproteobacteria bacterium]|nr:AsmA family protein [Alphaproteobacteria bacterium]MDD9919687.1 AsmA family protein [Alphaproteobacteria bacterium]
MAVLLKTLKYTFITLIVAVLCIAGWVVYQLQQPSKDLLESNIKKYTGYTAVIDGQPEFSVWPQLKLSISKMSIQAHSGDKLLFKGEELYLELSPWIDILQSGISVEKVALNNPAIYLHQPKNGLPNWQSPYRRGSSSKGGAAFIPVKELKIQNLNMVYLDDKAMEKHELTGADIQISGENPAALILSAMGGHNKQKFDVSGEMDVRDLQNIPLSLKAKMPLLSISLYGKIVNQAQWVGKVDIDSQDLPQLIHTHAPQTVLPVDLIGPFKVSSDVNVSAENVVLDNLHVSLIDKIDMTGKINIAPIQHKIGINTQFSRLNLDNLGVCGSKKEVKKGKKEAKSDPWSDTPLDISIFQNWMLDFKATVNQFTCAGVPVQSLYANIQGDKKQLHIKNVELNFQKNGKISLVGSSKVQSGLDGTLTTTLSQLPVEAFLSEKMAQQVQLPLNGKVDVTLKGKTTREIANNLSGAVDIKADSGRLPGAALSAFALSLEKTLAGVASSDNEVDELAIQYTIEDGIAKTENVALKTASGQINLTATGKIDLPNWTIYHRVEPVVSASTTFKVPVNIKGNLSSPKIVPEVANLQNLTTGAGAVLGGPAGAAAGAFLGKVLSGAASATKSASKTSPVDAETQPKEKVVNPLEELEGLFKKF